MVGDGVEKGRGRGGSTEWPPRRAAGMRLDPGSETLWEQSSSFPFVSPLCAAVGKGLP